MKNLRKLVRRLPALCLLLAVACDHGPQPQRLDKVQIELGGRKLAVEAACMPPQREMGMMYRQSLKPDEGMLFVFPHDEELAFYMKNTPVPLSIAFIKSDGVIANIAHMEPYSLETHRSRTECRFALEMPLGWFARNGVSEDSKVAIPDLHAE
ncbi:MAG: DUF192 domain-containing protein [Candidatus Brocadiia bacterium]